MAQTFLSVLGTGLGCFSDPDIVSAKMHLLPRHLSDKPFPSVSFRSGGLQTALLWAVCCGLSTGGCLLQLFIVSCRLSTVGCLLRLSTDSCRLFAVRCDRGLRMPPVWLVAPMGPKSFEVLFCVCVVSLE